MSCLHSDIRVRPAHVGIYLRYFGFHHFGFSSPRTRGDLSYKIIHLTHLRLFAPHTWGSISDAHRRHSPALVRPAHVGIYPHHIQSSRYPLRSPRTRGDLSIGGFALRPAIGFARTRGDLSAIFRTFC